ncbi:MAG TPA: alpha/beta fold hydrolase [Terracidiphilus sp.]|nr:alpha/beta fold hydrolase [Terracidiphilus sp.]
MSLTIPPPANPNPASQTPSPDLQSDSWLTPFIPRRGLGNAHLQTIVGNFLPRRAPELRAIAEIVVVDPNDASRVLCHCHWQPEPDRGARLTLILVHGLEGSSDSRYIRGITARAIDAGCNVVCMNMRNCGGTDLLTSTLYHSGRSADVGAVIDHFARRHALQRVALVGYSMGGNLVLKLAGEWGARPPLTAVAAVCPAMDLALSADALHALSNRLYERHFLRGLMRRYRLKATLFPSLYKIAGLGPIRSIREFDQKIVAPHCGFRDADDYYHRAAAARVVHNVAVPTLILFAADDPFIRLSPETRANILANPSIRLVETTRGGHCAFLSSSAGDEIHWAESTVVRYLRAVTANTTA